MDTAVIVRQLGSLRRGRGLRGPDISGKVGPALRLACGIGDTDDPGVIRSRVADCIRSHSLALPHDLRLSVLAALGLLDDVAHPLLQDRLEWVGRQLDREPRTVRRRVDAGLRLVAERLSAAAYPTAAEDENLFVPGGWYVAELRSTVRLDLDPAEVCEERSIIATRDSLLHTLVSLTAPGGCDGSAALDIRSSVIGGGRLLSERRLFSEHYQAVVELPHPLGIGDRHDYVVMFVVRPRAALRPYHLASPLRPCHRFRVCVTFDCQRPPAAVWRLDGVPRGLIGCGGVVGAPLVMDEHGRVFAEFLALHQGLSYGVYWSGPG